MPGRTSVAVMSSLALMVLATGEGIADPRTDEGPWCGIRWGSLAKTAPPTTSGAVVDARVGRHHCFDRLVLDVAGKAPPGFHVRYTDQLSAVGSGTPLPVAGEAVLTVTITAAGRDARLNPTVPWHAGSAIVAQDDLGAEGFQTLRSLVFGGSFEGRLAAGLGLRGRLPFRVFQLTGPGANSRIVVDVAHHW